MLRWHNLLDGFDSAFEIFHTLLQYTFCVMPAPSVYSKNVRAGSANPVRTFERTSPRP